MTAKRKYQERRKFTADEDTKLNAIVFEYGDKSWVFIANQMGGRTARQCRERWLNYLSPSAVKDPFSQEEDALLRKTVKKYGQKWSQMQKFFRGRTDVMLKNRWTNLKRHLENERKGKTNKTSKKASSKKTQDQPTGGKSEAEVKFDFNIDESEILCEFDPLMASF